MRVAVVLTEERAAGAEREETGVRVYVVGPGREALADRIAAEVMLGDNTIRVQTVLIEERGERQLPQSAR